MEKTETMGTTENLLKSKFIATDRAALTKNQVMDLAMDMGKILLKSGAETSRVEDTMMRFSPQLRLL